MDCLFITLWLLMAGLTLGLCASYHKDADGCAYVFFWPLMLGAFLGGSLIDWIKCKREAGN